MSNSKNAALKAGKTRRRSNPSLHAGDPIFTAIERHRTAYHAYIAAFCEDELEDAIPPEKRQSDFGEALRGDPDWKVATDDPAWIAHIETACRTDREQKEAAEELLNVKDLTPAGAMVLLRYAVEMESKDGTCWPEVRDDERGYAKSFQFFLMRRVADALDASSHHLPN